MHFIDQRRIGLVLLDLLVKPLQVYVGLFTGPAWLGPLS